MDSSGKRGAVEDSPGAQSRGAAHSLGAGTGAEGCMDSPAAETLQAETFLGPPEMSLVYAATGPVVTEGVFCHLGPIVSVPCPHSPSAASTSYSASSSSCPG